MSSNSIQMKYIGLRLTSSIWRVDMSYKLYPVCRFIYVVSSIHSFQFQFHHVTIAFTIMAHFINVIIYLSILWSSFVPLLSISSLLEILFMSSVYHFIHVTIQNTRTSWDLVLDRHQ
jgi:hypothetical protein